MRTVAAPASGVSATAAGLERRVINVSATVAALPVRMDTATTERASVSLDGTASTARSVCHSCVSQPFYCNTLERLDCSLNLMQ